MKLGDQLEPVQALLEVLGEEGMEQALGAWIALRHCVDRPALLSQAPIGPARAGHYLAFVRELPCSLCRTDPPSDPHHFGKRGLGQKTDDYRTVPLCRNCHSMAHRGELNQATIRRNMVETLVKYLRSVENR